ncbi:hypothetical protein A3A05_02455 [Candidatus Nomurabacteria bacterium RIFCSPLOWO2_01_FULL_41_12]|uniref:Uncharacterized protein n=1 Tax=Candidatus Nomurabacteria bacterium RIFCSPLOWO2_01_FULL_41_12 TaxID=1801774 RepID=A0A1F6WUL0_9BACT|nr:MAG: hypothetical protein A2732_00295 [Candidatus Nomurabacteria bacterium RIFCSPHIGHO2_01_FULL_40_10]OGI85567.1 MAG: hypothetical protein A3A05_02455 [Candidatus Nomurabacteria bacterium RIFCSPLOWO2_01_FULL_41_12]
MIKFFKKEKSFKKKSLSLNLNLYWKLAIYFVFAMILLSGFYGFYLFTQINKESIITLSGGGQIGTARKEKIEKVLEYFSLRKKKSIEIINFPSPVVDPSL